jgi:hypothetical protein
MPDERGTPLALSGITDARFICAIEPYDDTPQGLKKHSVTPVRALGFFLRPAMCNTLHGNSKIFASVRRNSRWDAVKPAAMNMTKRLRSL